MPTFRRSSREKAATESCKDIKKGRNSAGLQPETSFLFTMKVLDGSHERAMPAWANSWISDRLDRMSKQGDSPNYECGGSCGSAKGAQQLTFMYSCAAIRRHVRFTSKNQPCARFSNILLQKSRSFTNDISSVKPQLFYLHTGIFIFPDFHPS